MIWQLHAVFHSMIGLVGACIGSLTWSFAGPRRASQIDMDLWGYTVRHHQGENSPFVGYYSTYQNLLNHYGPWFDGQAEVLLDSQRVKYLKECCGWADVSDDQLKNREIQLRGFKGTEVAYHIDQNRLIFILKGVHVSIRGNIEYTESFIRHKSIHLPN